MEEIGKFISFIAGVGFLLATMGTLKEVTSALRDQAAKDYRRGMFSIGAYNRKLFAPAQKSKTHKAAHLPPNKPMLQ